MNNKKTYIFIILLFSMVSCSILIYKSIINKESKNTVFSETNINSSQISNNILPETSISISNSSSIVSHNPSSSVDKASQPVNKQQANDFTKFLVKAELFYNKAERGTCSSVIVGENDVGWYDLKLNNVINFYSGIDFSRLTQLPNDNYNIAREGRGVITFIHPSFDYLLILDSKTNMAVLIQNTTKDENTNEFYYSMQQDMYSNLSKYLTRYYNENIVTYIEPLVIDKDGRMNRGVG